MQRSVGRARLGPRLLAVLAALAIAPLLLCLLFVTSALRQGWLEVAAGARPTLLGFGLLLLVGAVGAAGLLWWFLSRNILRPLRELRDEAQRLGSGDFEGRLAIRSDDELAEAAAGLNRLAERIGAITGSLEDRVAERTRELGRAMGELHLLKKLNDAIIHNMPSGIAILADDGRLLYLNASFEQTWQIHPSELGQALQALGRGGPLGEIDWRGEVARLMRDGETLRNVLVTTGQWPNRRVVRYSLFLLPPAQLDGPLRLVGDEFCLAVLSPPGCGHECEHCFAHSSSWKGRHALLLIDDITEQHQLEAQLIQSEKLAALGQLSAGVAHEIRNPLSAISGAAFYIGDVLTDDVPDLSDIEEYVRLIQRNVDRAQRIVTDILNFARPSDAEGGVCDLAELAEQTLAILDKAMVDQGIELQRDLQKGIMVRCRAETVKQALLNLIVNGMQAMPEGGVLHVETAYQESQPVLLVNDTGCGIPPENLNQIFNPFFTTKPAGQGTGLGLSIARQAIENDKGRLEVESQRGKGTTFRILLPPVEVEEAEGELMRPAAGD